VSRATGIQFVNPSQHCLDVVSKIRRSRLVLTESLHGAILADAFRIRWIPIRFSYRFLNFKWIDWCQSVGVEFAPVDLPPAFQGRLARGNGPQTFCGTSWVEPAWASRHGLGDPIERVPIKKWMCSPQTWSI